MRTPFTAEWTNEVAPRQPLAVEPEIEPTPEQPLSLREGPGGEQIIANGFYWLAYDSPSAHQGFPVEVRGTDFYLPGSATRYAVERVLEKGNGKFTPLVALAAVGPWLGIEERKKK